jgi:uncharacterized protein
MIVYFDASALVPLYVRDRTSAAAIRARGSADALATSLLSYGEVLGAFAQILRRRAISKAAHRLAVSRFLADWPTFQRVPLVPRLLGEVRRLIDSHPLKGADAVQLASALQVLQGVAAAGFEGCLACDDRAIARAGREEGLRLAW